MDLSLVSRQNRNRESQVRTIISSIRTVYDLKTKMDTEGMQTVLISQDSRHIHISRKGISDLQLSESSFSYPRIVGLETDYLCKCTHKANLIYPLPFSFERPCTQEIYSSSLGSDLKNYEIINRSCFKIKY